MKSEGLITIILAAGKGTRMKSKLPKVLHCAGGKPMVEHVLDAAKSAGSTRNIVVVGFGREQVQAVLGDKAEIVLQEEQLGTGHAVMQAEPLINSMKNMYNQELKPLYLQHLCQTHLAMDV